MRYLRYAGFLLIYLLAVGCKKEIKNQETISQKKFDTPATTIAVGTIYYISSTGNDNNNGTSASTPWKTITKVNSKTFLAGDQVLFQGGQTFSGNLIVNANGISGSYVRFSSYGNGKASINAGTGMGIYVYNKPYIWIDNLIVYGSWNATNQTGNTGYGIFYYTDQMGGVKISGVFVSNCEVKGFKNAGIILGAYPGDGSQSGFTGVNLSSNKVHDNGDAGIFTFGNTPTAGSTAYAHTNVYIGYNSLYNNLGVKNKGSNSGSGIILSDLSAATVEHNVAYNNGWYNNYSEGGPVGIWCYDATDVTFQYNESHHNGSSTADGDGFDLDGGVTNCIMQYNYSHDNYGAGYLLWEYGDIRGNNANNIIRYNISQNDATNTFYGGITIGDNCNNNRFYNNTIYSSKSVPVKVLGGTANWFINNIFFSNSRGNYAAIINTPNCWFLNNNYYGDRHGLKLYYYGGSGGATYTTLGGFRAAGQETYNNVNYGYSVNPLLSSPGNGGNINTGTPSTLTNYNLNAGSSMINTGFNLTSWGFNVGSIDFRGASIPYNGAYDIGACERH